MAPAAPGRSGTPTSVRCTSCLPRSRAAKAGKKAAPAGGDDFLRLSNVGKAQLDRGEAAPAAAAGCLPARLEGPAARGQPAVLPRGLPPPAAGPPA